MKDITNFRKLKSFDEARKFVRNKKITSAGQYKNFKKQGKLPLDMPSGIRHYSKNKKWISAGHFFGTGRIADQYRKFKSFEEHRKYAHSLKLKQVKDWFHLSKSKKKPIDIVLNPQRRFRKQWKGWGDFLGTGIKQGKSPRDEKRYRSFDELKKFVKKSNIKSRKDWEKFIKSRKKPKDIPVAIWGVYKNKGWKGWPDFLGKKTK